MMVFTGTRDIVEQRESILTFLRIKFGFTGTDGTVIFYRLAAQGQVFKQDGTDKFIKAVSVTGAVMIFQNNAVTGIAAQEQIAIGILRTHPVRGHVIFKRQDNRRFVNVTIGISGFTACQTHRHLRETNQSKFKSLLQQFRLYRLRHTDDVTRRGGQIPMCCIHKNVAIGIHIQNGIIMNSFMVGFHHSTNPPCNADHAALHR